MRGQAAIPRAVGRNRERCSPRVRGSSWRRDSCALIVMRVDYFPLRRSGSDLPPPRAGRGGRFLASLLKRNRPARTQPFMPGSQGRFWTCWQTPLNSCGQPQPPAMSSPLEQGFGRARAHPALGITMQDDSEEYEVDTTAGGSGAGGQAGLHDRFARSLTMPARMARTL